MANNDKENKIEKFTKEAIGKTLNQFNKEIGIADLVEINKNQDRILNGILSQVNDENTEKTEKSNIITLDNSTDGIVELKEIQGDTNVNVSKIEEMPITHDIGDKEGDVFTLNEIPKGAISIGEIQGNTMVNCNKDDKKELVLMKDLSTQGDNNITLTEGVDGGKVDVALEGNTLVNVSKTKDNYITHEKEEDTTGNHIALADEGYIRPVLNGKTMVNVCDQKDPIAVTKSYTVENSGNHVALQGEYDGKCRPVVTGNTLVNLASNSNLWEVGCSGDVNTDYTITSTDDQGIVIDKLTDNVDYLYLRKKIDIGLFKPSTTYTIIFNSSKAYRVGIVSGNTAETALPLLPCNDGYNTITVTSTDFSTITGTAPIYAYLSIGKQYIGTAKVSDFIALEGDYSDKPIPDYFEGLQSTFEDNLVTQEMIDNGEEVADNLGKYRVDYKVTGKNLLEYPYIDTNKTVNGITFTDNGDGSITVNGTSTGVTNFFIRTTNEWFLPKGTYTFTSSNSQVTAFAGGDAGNIGTNAGKPSTTFTIKENPSKFGKLLLQIDAGKTFDNAILYPQLEEGSTPTEYEPYKEYTKTLYLNSPLLEGDTIEQYGNNIVHVHRYGKVVLDGGTSPWGNTWWESTSNTTDTVFSGGLSSAPYEDIGYCDKLLIVTPSNLSSYDTAITIDGESIIRINIPKELLSRNKDLSAFRTWLNANPITFVGKLKTPQYEVVSTNDELLADSYVNGHLDFESAVPVDKVVFNTANFNNKYLYNNTEYIVQFESDNIGKIYFLALGRNDSEALASKNVVKGINKFKVSTSDKNSNYFYLDGIGFNASNIVVTPAIEQDFEYFSGLSNTFEDGLVTQEMVDSGEEEADNLGKYKVEYKTTGKNKAKNPLYLKGSQYEPCVKAVANLKPNTTYTLSLIVPEGQFFVVDYTKTFTKRKGILGDGTRKSIVVTTRKDIVLDGLGRTYIFFNETNYSSDGTASDLMIEEGDTATSYEPYKEHIKTLYLNSPLLEGDTIEEKDDGIYHVHKFNKAVLSANLNWFFNEEYNYIECKNSTIAHKPDSKLTICDKLPTVINITTSNIGITTYLKGSSQWRITNKSLSSLDEYISWLQNNPLTAVYELETPQYELIEQQSNLAIPSYANGHLDLPSAVPVSKVNFLHFEEELTYLYPATSYTIQFVSDKAVSIDITLGGTQLLAQSITRGVNRISITTPETLVDNKLIIDGAGAKISDVVVTDTDREFKYFEGMKSVGEGEELEVKSGNKNLVDVSKLKCYNTNCTTVSVNNNTITVTSTQPATYCYYAVKLNWLKPHTTYTVQGILSSSRTDSTFRVFDFKTNGATVTVFFEDKATFTTPQDVSELCLLFYISTDDECSKGDVATFTDIQIEEGSVATDYIPYQSNTQQLTHEPLRGVGDAKDRYVLIDGKWYIERKCKEDIVDGTEESWTPAETSESHSKFYLYNYGIKNEAVSGAFILSDRFTLAEHTTMPTHEYIRIENNLDISISNSKLSTQDVSGFKQWLQNNPTKVVYQLATPVYEPIDYNPLEVYSDTTHISTNSAIPTNITIKNHGFNCLLKPSTTYTVSSSRGINTVTTGVDIGDSCLRFYNEDTSNVTTMKNVLVLEGDWTSKPDIIPANFSGIESAFEQELVTDENDVNYGKYKVTAKVVGKNLIPYWLLGKYDKFSGTTEWSNNYIRTPLIHVHERQYIFSRANDKAITILTYDKNKKFLKCIIDKTFKSKQITLDNNVHYIAIHYYTDDTSNTLQNIEMELNQLEQGDTATAYEPYKESSVTFYLNEPLRGVENSKDRVFIQGDKIIVERNCGSYTFDGSDDEYWEKEEARFSISISNVIPNRFSKAINNALFTTDSLVTDDQYDSYAIINGWGGTNKLYLRDINKFTTLAELKQYLQQNPVTVVYELAEPTYEEVEYSSNRLILNTFNNESFNNSTLFLDTTILPKLSFKPLYEKLVYVKNSTKYYIQFNAVGSGEVVINLGGTELTTEIVEGYNCIPITTPSESTNLMVISGQGITISEVVVSEVVCGGYYKGLQSCFEEHMENGKYRVLLRGIALDGSKVNGIKLYINEPLRGMGNTKDRLCIKDGKLMIERKCSEVKLDENSNIMSISGLYLENTVIFKLDIPIKNYDYYICDNFECYYSMSLSNKDIEGTYSFDNSIRFRILRSKLNGESYDDFKQWLQQNPVTVVYQLAEPTYEEVTNEYGLPIVFEGYENGIVYIDSAVTPTTHIKYTSNNQLATTLAEAEEQNIATQEDINMNVVTYMMDIDMILTEMEMSNDTSVMAVRRDNSNENMLDRMSDEDKKVYQDNTVVMLEKMITANVLEKEDIEGRINMYYNKNRISKEQYEYLKSLL